MRSLLIAFIWFVSAADIFCCQWLTSDTEVNPVARWILVTYSVWYLIGLKVLGTYAVTEVLRYLPLVYSVAVAMFMAWLLGVLYGVFPC